VKASYLLSRFLMTCRSYRIVLKGRSAKNIGPYLMLLPSKVQVLEIIGDRPRYFTCTRQGSTIRLLELLNRLMILTEHPSHLFNFLTFVHRGFVYLIKTICYS
jgi:hypothetical protein